ncbi:MAG: hypothetical protein KDG89_04010 [Geminicoccaceae bacterium]|nr:hypothetical protein [Geminicoccaceae bacterium]
MRKPFDVNVLVALHKANFNTLLQAQGVLFDTTQAMARLGYALFEENLRHAERLLTTKAEPGMYASEAKAAAERAVLVSKEQAGLGLHAQRAIADLVTKRVQAGVDEMQMLTA